MTLRKIPARLAGLRALLARGEYSAALAQATSRVMPAGNAVAYWDRFVIVELTKPRLSPRAPPAALVEATRSDLERLCAAFPAHAEAFRRRAAEGQRCFVIKDADNIVARQWLIRDRPSYTSNSGLEFAPRARPSLWCHDIYVDPAYRMRGHFVALMLNAQRPCEDGRRPRLYGEIHFLNERSLRAHASLGFRVIHHVTVLSVAALKLYVIQNDRGQRTFSHRWLWHVPHN